MSWDSLQRGDRTQIGWPFQGTTPPHLAQEKWLACSATLQWPKTFIRRRPCRPAEIGPSKEGCPPTREMRHTLAPRGINSNFSFLLSLKTHTRAHYFFPRAVSKEHTTANSYLVILSCSWNTLKKAVMPKRRLIYTAIKRLAWTF